MVREYYKKLRQHKLEQCASYYQAESEPLRRVTIDSPALDVMTDLKRIQAVTIGPDATLGAVNKAMMRNTVRSLLVADEKRCILGVITSTDTLGEKPMQIVRERGIRHEDVLARDIMTPCDRPGGNFLLRCLFCRSWPHCCNTEIEWPPACISGRK